MKPLRRVAMLERLNDWFIRRYVTELEMPLNPALKRWAKFRGRYAVQYKMNQYPVSVPLDSI